MKAQDLNVSGTVTDGSGAPLPGVSVVVKGSTRGATTAVSGSYTINAPADATLVFSLMGMAPREEPINGRGRIDVTLSEDDQYKRATIIGTVQIEDRKFATHNRYLPIPQSAHDKNPELTQNTGY
jgi:hypothetical protein